MSGLRRGGGGRFDDELDPAVVAVPRPDRVLGPAGRAPHVRCAHAADLEGGAGARYAGAVMASAHRRAVWHSDAAGLRRRESDAPRRELLDRDARLPQERRRLRQGGGLAAGRRADTGPLAPADADLVVVNTCAFIEAARPGVDRHRAGSGRRQAGRRPAGGHGLPGRALRRRTGRRPARGRRRGGLRRRGVDLRGRAAPAPEGRAPRPARAAPAGAGGAMGLREGGRGLRPDLRLLCHPVVPGEAALPAAGVDPGRGPEPRGRWSPGDRPGGPGPGLLWA